MCGHSPTAGIRRTGKKELSEGNIDVSFKYSPYVSKNLTYSSEDLTSYNIVNNKEAIINTLKKTGEKGSASMTEAEGTSSQTPQHT